MIFKLCKFILILFLLNSCDILRVSQFEVTSWSPGGGYHPEPEKIVVSLNFSNDPDKDSVERRFSLAGDNGRVKGIFRWEGRKMIFTPLAPLEKNNDYALNLSADARDTKGLSMDTAFECNFTTRQSDERPVPVSCYPSMYAEINDPRMEVRLGFSTPLSLNTLYNNVSFNPSMTGSWRLDNNGKTAIFTPAEPWTINKRYEIHFSASLSDNNGMNTRNDFTSVFTIGTDHEVPELLYAYRIAKNGDFFPLELDSSGFVSASELPKESQGWEKEDRLSLVFSELVDSLSVKNCLSVEDASSLVMETFPGYETEFVFRFETIPVYESRFTFRLKPGVKDSAGNESGKEYIYRVFANGKHSKPPTLAGIRLPMAPGSETDQELVHFGTDSLFERIPIRDGENNYPSREDIETWIELYFITAEGASIDSFSLMELFRIETSNNVLTFSPRRVKTDNFSVTSPQTGWENFERLEITGNLVNSINYGVVSFQISPGLKDSFGNKNDKTLRISLIK